MIGSWRDALRRVPLFFDPTTTSRPRRLVPPQLSRPGETIWTFLAANTDVLKNSLRSLPFPGNLCSMAQNPDVRWRQRLQSFGKAFAQLSKAAALAAERDLTELEQQGLIQAFEFTHELAWKTLKDFLESKGVPNIYGSKVATRQAFATGLIEDGDAWMAMIESRNLTSHTYNEDLADEITTSILTRYVLEFGKFQRKFAELEKEPQA